MESTTNLTGYPASVNLKYYAASYQEKQKEDKRKEKELLNAIAEKEILKIKRNAWCAFTSQRSVMNSVDIQKIEDEFIDNYFVDLLNFNYLLTLNGIRSQNFKMLRLLTSCYGPNENIVKGVSEHKKPNILSTSLEAIKNIVYGVTRVTKIVGQIFTSFIFRSVAIYYCYELRNRMQRFIVPLKDVTRLREINRSNFSNIYFVKIGSPYDVILLLASFYWNNVKIPTIFFHGCAKPWLCWILQKIGLILQDFEDFKTEDGDLNSEKLEIEVKRILEGKRDIVFTLQKNIEDEIYVLLQIIENNLRNSVIEDTFLTTFHISNERYPENAEENALILGQRKLLHSTNVRRAYNLFKTNIGFARLTCGDPFPLKKAISSEQENLLNFVDAPRKSMKNEVTTRLIRDFSNYQIVMSTNLISFILLYKFRDGVKFSDLVKDVDHLRKELIDQKRLGFTGDTQSVVNHAIDTLRSALEVTKVNDEYVIKPILHLPDVLELHCLSHVTLNYFKMDAVIMTCLAVSFKSRLEDIFKSDENQLTFYYTDFIEKVEQLCDILRMEFAFENHCQSLSNKISDAMFKFIELEYFTKNEKLLTEEEQWSHRMAKHLESDDEDDPYYSRNRGDVYTVNFHSNMEFYPKIMFYKRSLAPIIHTYVTAFEHVEKLDRHGVIYAELIKQIFNKLKFSLDNHQLEYPESVSVSLVRNSIKLLQEWNVLKSYTVDDIKVLYLAKQYRNSRDLSEIKYKVSNFR